MTEINFVKMHGLGNDFIVIDCLRQPLHKPSEFAQKFCNRRFGIGADQVLLLCPSTQADFKMLIFNADGSEVEMCGNGIRCIAKYIWDCGYSQKDVLEIETLAGIIKPAQISNMVKVDMGKPTFSGRLIPVKLDMPEIIDYPVTIDDMTFNITCVSMGNPHAVIFLTDDINDFNLPKYGPLLEHHELFPKRTNVEFVNVLSKKEIAMRVWERGSGETLACGTGACASAVASIKKGLTESELTVHLRGGDLIIKWENTVFMTGPAETVFKGSVLWK